ncbi:hypothetical protein FGB62_25g617 [Gracilaria domingensis]|nr:hypothetical protein FGB62_25g617 [Gracilaria domingensis]
MFAARRGRRWCGRCAGDGAGAARATGRARAAERPQAARCWSRRAAGGARRARRVHDARVHFSRSTVHVHVHGSILLGMIPSTSQILRGCEQKLQRSRGVEREEDGRRQELPEHRLGNVLP